MSNILARALRTTDGQSGLVFMAVGIIAVVGASQYPIGTLARMGPGFFPLCLGILLVVVGLISLAGSLRSDDVIAEPVSVRALVVITLAVVVSALLLLQAGLLVAIPALVIISAFASPSVKWLPLLVTTVVLTALAYGVFVWGLNMQIPLVWW
ncbi:MAG TPA: tripartite tricarboxylate transporter TctB family protein [Beijerinckiaceae bacterium]|jgi:drug/metabolite transporter (DMT)-like permease|nr:tripartite tricarboxylate transporter TctB family protein [Beijerinckiaceae bacterium]